MSRINDRKKKPFHPVVLDEIGKIRAKFEALYRKTKIEKCALAGKAMEIGLATLEKGLLTQ